MKKKLYTILTALAILTGAILTGGILAGCSSQENCNKGHDYVCGVCTRCGEEQQLTAEFVANGTTIKEIHFTVSTQNVVKEQEPEVPEREGYENKGWQYYELGWENITIDAVYDPILYSITYQDEKNAPNDNLASYTIEDEVYLAPLESLGYKFEGWYLGEQKLEIIPVGTTGNLTLQAHWSLIHYSITYNGVDPKELNLPEEYTIESEIVLPTDLGEKDHEFLGWELNGTMITSIPKGSYGDITLYALFDVTDFRVTLDATGGSVSKTSVRVAYLEKYNLPVPTREGYNFLGWFTSSGESGTPCTDENGASLGTYTIYADKVFYAHWSKKICRVVYDSQGRNPVFSRSYKYGDLFVPENIAAQNGYLLDGWYNADGTVRYTETTPVTENMTVYAHWIESTPVSTPEELQAIAQNPTANYHLTQNINLRGALWTPIEEFSGILNGNGYSIIGFNLSCTEQVENFGFIKVNKGRIESLKFEDVILATSVESLFGDMRVGLFAATNQGTVLSCAALSGSINVAYTSVWDTNSIYYCPFGSVVGYNASDATVTGCYSNIDVECSVSQTTNDDGNIFERKREIYFRIGGVVGENAGTVTESHFSANMHVKNYAKGILMGGLGGSKWRYSLLYPQIGGVVGCNTDGELSKCYSEAGIKVESSVENLAAHVYGNVGGICGSQSGQNGKITSCYADGTISGSGDETTIGGCLGTNQDNAQLTASYSRVDITSTGVGEYGGLVGLNEAIIRNCYSTGDVSCTNANEANCLGGFVGHGKATSNISMCYSTGNVSTKGGSAGIFLGLNDLGGSVYKAYYLSGATVELNGTILSQVTEFGVTSKQVGELWSEDFLISELYWDREGWIVLFDEDPILDWETSVSHSYETYVVDPTCEDFGYTVYVCRDCDRIFVRNYIRPLGHDFDYDNPVVREHTCVDDGHTYYHCRNEENSVLYDSGIIDPATGHVKGEILETHDATCTQAGSVRFTCSECGETITETIEPKGHTLPVSGDDGNATKGSCVKGGEVVMGRTASVTCIVCGTVIRKSEEVSPHQYVISEETKATCTTEGKQVRKCVICDNVEEVVLPATGHTVLEGTARCAVCQEFVIDDSKIIEIKTAEELKNIAHNLSGIYMLKANIDLRDEDWTPIGTKNAPFKGWLFGGDFEITGLNVSGSRYGGLFGYNEGHLVGLTIENADLSAANIGEASLGAFAAVNNGYIQGCTLSGTVHFSLSIARTVDNFDAQFADFVSYAGGFAGENGVRGEITDCSLNAAVTFTLTHSMRNTAEVNWSYYVSKVWKRDNAISVASFYAGGIAGVNRGLIASCNVTGSTFVQNEQHLDVRHHGTIPTLLGKKQYSYNAGFATITTNIYAGSLVGFNANTVQTSSAKLINFKTADGVTTAEGLLFGTKMEMKTQWPSSNGYGSLVGANSDEAVCDNLIAL